jgi:hypothetical protein
MGARKAIVFVNRPEYLAKIVEVCQTGGLVAIMGEVCDELFIEIVSPVSTGHPMVRHLMKCCGGP